MRWAGCVMLLSLGFAGCGGSSRLASGGGTASSYECAPYARDTSGIQLYGDAAAWWDQAAGHYARSETPQTGAVLGFRRRGRPPAPGRVGAFPPRRAPAVWACERGDVGAIGTGDCGDAGKLGASPD